MQLSAQVQEKSNVTHKEDKLALASSVSRNKPEVQKRSLTTIDPSVEKDVPWYSWIIGCTWISLKKTMIDLLIPTAGA